MVYSLWADVTWCLVRHIGLLCYCSDSSSELEVPTLLLMVAVTEAMAWIRASPLGALPVRLNGTATWNWPPKAWEAVLWNQTVAAPLTSIGGIEDGTLKPVAAVNVTLSEERLRVVV